MKTKEVERISKFLSLVLRHQPETVDLQLDEQGWAGVDELLEKLRAHHFHVDKALLQEVVDSNNKKRFAFNDDSTKIRASQGHSIAVDLGYLAKVPPAILYHGTAEKNVAAIFNEGLHKKSRQHVHLSADRETAIVVGRRHGKPVILQVMAGKMHNEGYSFFLSANGVWLTANVPPAYLQRVT